MMQIKSGEDLRLTLLVFILNDKTLVEVDVLNSVLCRSLNVSTFISNLTIVQNYGSYFTHFSASHTFWR